MLNTLCNKLCHLSILIRSVRALKQANRAFKQKKLFLFLSLILNHTMVFAIELNSAHQQASDQKQFQSILLADNTSISAEEAINIAKQGRNSKVLKISKKNQDGREFYRIKLITPKGLVRVVLVDAVSGQRIQGND